MPSSGIQPRQVTQQQIIPSAGASSPVKFARLTARDSTNLGFFSWEEVVWHAPAFSLAGVKTDYQPHYFWTTRVVQPGETILDSTGNPIKEGQPASTSANEGQAVEMNRRNCIPLGWNNIVQICKSPAVFDEDGASYWLFDSPMKWIWAELQGVFDEGGNRWTYTFTERVRITTTAFSAPADWTALFITTAALNGIEANNTGSGIEGHGVNVSGADYPAAFALIDAGLGNPIVRMSNDMHFNNLLDTDGNAADPSLSHLYSFEFVNSDDGECDP